MITQLFLLFLGFVLLVKGADFFVDGASALATKLGIPQLVIGLTIVAMGTSLPEAAVSISAVYKNTADIALANVIGSNILNILLILGLSSLFSNMAVQNSTQKIEIPYMIIVTVILVFMGLDGYVKWYEGLCLLLLFAIYLFYLFCLTKKQKQEKIDGKISMAKSIAMLIIGLATVVFASNIAVDASVNIASKIGISERVIGLTIVAFGTSLPELVTSIMAAKKGKADIAIGNIVGSNIFNILFIVGTSALLKPLVYEVQFLQDGTIAVFACVLLWLALIKQKKLVKKWGFVLLLAYALYFAYLLIIKS